MEETAGFQLPERSTVSSRKSGVLLTRRRRICAALTFLGLLAAGTIGLGRQLVAAPAVKYRLASLDVGPVVNTITAAGAVKPRAAILVGSQASGQIDALLADFNASVKQGDVLARLNDEGVQARLAQALVEVEVAASAAEIQRAQLERTRIDAQSAIPAVAAAKADVARAKAVLVDAEREFWRKRELVDRGSGSLAERDRAEGAHDSARAQLAAAQAREAVAVASQATSEAAIAVAAAQLDNALAQVKQREALVRQARIELDHTVIRAPIDGIVIDRNVEIGQILAASLQVPTLFTIAPDLRAMEVHATVDEADIGRVAVGQDVSFTVDSFPQRPFQGRVVDVRKVPQTTQNVVAYTVIVSAANEELLLLPGMTANTRIVVQKRAEVLRIPNAALRFRPGGEREQGPVAPGDGAQRTEVWVIGAAGVPEARTVKLGTTDGSATELIEGSLQRGDRVILGVQGS
ncbi:efflux RND transporter periplasmic adaptor subunit [Bradyrhizobium diazoefficiens]|nr:efflux RND transporter periplasmic adaptor subunit [Bradyrhizobium diazoefficiens]MBR0851609.1 efflux RND transporter periplasmic adaptor subunit [Bradyrhizobium diazoefficiens]